VAPVSFGVVNALAVIACQEYMMTNVFQIVKSGKCLKQCNSGRLEYDEGF